MNFGLDVSFLTFSKSNLCAGRDNWHILFRGISLQSQPQSLEQHSFTIKIEMDWRFKNLSKIINESGNFIEFNIKLTEAEL